MIEQYREYNGIEEKGEDNLIPEGNEVLGLRKLVAEVVAQFLKQSKKNLVKGIVQIRCKEQESSIKIPPQRLEFFVGHAVTG